MGILKKYIALSFVIIALNSFCYAQNQKDLSEIDVLRAEMSYMKDKNSAEFLKSKARLQKLINQNNVEYSRSARFSDALRLINEKKYDAAIYELNSLIEERYNLTRCYELLGDICQYSQRPPKKTVSYYKESLKYDPDNISTLYKLAKLYFANNKNILGIECLTKVVENTDDYALLNKIEELIKTNTRPQSANEFNNFYELLGNVQMKLGKKDDSFMNLLKALKANPSDIFLKYYLVESFYNENCLDDTVKMVNIILQEENDTQLKTTKAKALAKSGNITPAYDIYIDVLKNNPSSKQAKYGIYKLFENRLDADKILAKVYFYKQNYIPTKDDCFSFAKLLNEFGEDAAARNYVEFGQEIYKIEQRGIEEQRILAEKQRDELALKLHKEKEAKERILKEQAEKKAQLEEQQKQKALALKKQQEEKALAYKKAQLEKAEKQKQQQLQKLEAQKKAQEEKLRKQKEQQERLKQQALAKQQEQLKKKELEKARLEKLQKEKEEKERISKEQAKLSAEELARKQKEQKEKQELERLQKLEQERKIAEEKKLEQERLEKLKREEAQKEYEKRKSEQELNAFKTKNPKKYNEYKSAIDNYLKAEKKDSKIYLAVANTYKMMEAPTVALGYLKEAIKLDPTNSDLYYNLGLTYMELDSFETAKYNLEKALNLEPNSAKVKNILPFVNQKLVTRYINNAYSKFEEKKYVDSSLILDEGIKKFPNHAQLYYYRALAYDAMNRNAAAIIDLQKAIDLDPSLHMAYYQLGKSYEKIHDERNALVAFERFLSVEPDEKDLINEIQNKVLKLSEKYY